MKNVPAKNRFFEKESMPTCFFVAASAQCMFDIDPLSFKIIGYFALNSETFHQPVWDFFPHLYHLREINVLLQAKNGNQCNGKRIDSMQFGT